MQFSKYVQENLGVPPATKVDFLKAFEESVEGFSQNLLFQRIDQNECTLKDLHTLLHRIFHQVRYSSSSFALAGGQCAIDHLPAKLYLIHHAEEEMSHWEWILNDLKATGFDGADPRTVLPHVRTEAYIAYAMYLASTFPVGRLAMAVVLEGISGKFGLPYGKKVAQQLQLKPEQVSFFLQHGELDQGHTQEITEVFDRLEITGRQWTRLIHICHCTSQLYAGIYNSVVEDL